MLEMTVTCATLCHISGCLCWGWKPGEGSANDQSICSALLAAETKIGHQEKGLSTVAPFWARKIRGNLPNPQTRPYEPSNLKTHRGHTESVY